MRSSTPSAEGCTCQEGSGWIVVIPTSHLLARLSIPHPGEDPFGCWCRAGQGVTPGKHARGTVGVTVTSDMSYELHESFHDLVLCAHEWYCISSIYVPFESEHWRNFALLIHVCKDLMANEESPSGSIPTPLWVRAQCHVRVLRCNCFWSLGTVYVVTASIRSLSHFKVKCTYIDVSIQSECHILPHLY